MCSSDLQAGLSDPDVVRWLGEAPGSAEDVLALNHQRWTEGSPTFSVCSQHGLFAGLVWVNVSPDDPGVGEVGYWLLERARGRGLATRAVRLVVTWATGDAGLRRLTIVVDGGNERSQRVAERSGFHRADVGTTTADPGPAFERVVFELRLDAIGNLKSS